MAKTGPKRKTGVGRYPGGQIKHSDRVPEEPADIVALEARVRQLLSVEKWLECRANPAAMAAARDAVRDRDLGSPLGKLRMLGRDDGISRKQHSAGVYFAWLVNERNMLRGPPSPNVQAVNYGCAPTPTLEPVEPVSFSEHEKGTEEWEKDVLRRYERMYGAIIQADRHGGKIFEILRSTLIVEAMPKEDELGDLRMGLNAIDRARGA